MRRNFTKDPIISMAILFTVVTIILSFIDASMIVYQRIESKKVESMQFSDWLLNIPWWWVVVIILLIMFIIVGIVSFLLGKKKIDHEDYKRLSIVAFIPILLMISGTFDLISATVIEYLRGNHPFNWMNYKEWWWTMYHPFPRISAFVAGRTYPISLDMIVSSLCGLFILTVLLFENNSSKFKKRKIMKIYESIY